MPPVHCWQWQWHAGCAYEVYQASANECGSLVQSPAVGKQPLTLNDCIFGGDSCCFIEDENELNDENVFPFDNFNSQFVPCTISPVASLQGRAMKNAENERRLPKDIVQDSIQGVTDVEIFNVLAGLECPDRLDVFHSEDFRFELLQLVKKFAKNRGSRDADYETVSFERSVWKTWLKMHERFLAETNVLEHLSRQVKI